MEFDAISRMIRPCIVRLIIRSHLVNSFAVGLEFVGEIRRVSERMPEEGGGMKS